MRNGNILSTIDHIWYVQKCFVFSLNAFGSGRINSLLIERNMTETENTITQYKRHEYARMSNDQRTIVSRLAKNNYCTHPQLQLCPHNNNNRPTGQAKTTTATTESTKKYFILFGGWCVSMTRLVKTLPLIHEQPGPSGRYTAYKMTCDANT